jgi:hypothetical protein
MQTTKNIIANIRKEAARLIVDEIFSTGSANCYNTAACIVKVKTQLGIELKENAQGYLVFA